MNRKRQLKTRLIGNVVLACAVTGCLVALILWQQANLKNAAYNSGGILLASLFFLASYNLRKKIPFLALLGTSRFWMQLHIYVGLSTFLIFAVHIGFRIPNGWFESILAILYLVVAFSGVYGLYITRTIPKKLTHINDEVIFEQIPARKRQLAEQLEQLAMSTFGKSETIARFYVNRLSPFFEKPRPVAYFVRPTTRESRKLQNEIGQLDRYLAGDQTALCEQLSDMVRHKDNLDYHHAMQGRLKYWLFLHVGLTYSLLLVGVVHGIMALAFHGGVR